MYQALYRKWRPRTFDDVISQPHITTTLKNQIQSGKTAHAYLFTGSRGTGKTTCARIFAKAINCLHATDGNPCQQCEICRDAEAFSLSDIIEIDAASNNGVDDIRELRDGAVYTPERCKYKVYIIDEVHMLSQSAFNALLKIMEEPPAFVKFILATTEIHKVPATIVSRCQRFDFRRILPEDITARLLYIAGEEQLTLDEQAARLIARLSDGGMRDALSLLDQCAAYDSNITLDTVSAAAGIAGRDALFDLLDAMTQSDPAKAVRILDELYAKSKDMLRLCEEMIAQLRNVMLLHVTNGDTSLLACMPEEITRLEGIRSAMPLQQVIDRLSVLQACNERLGRAINKRVELELCLIRLCSPQISQKSPQTLDNSQIYDKIKQLEATIAALRQGGYQPIRPQEKPVAAPADRVHPEEPKVDMSKLRQEDFKPLANWAEVLAAFNKVNPAVSGTLANSKAFVNGNLLLIFAENALFMQLFRQREHAVSLGDCIQQVLGKRYAIRAKCSVKKQEISPAEALIQKANSSQIETAVE